MNSRESSIRTCQLDPSRWSQSPRAWACVSCVCEDVLPASDPHFKLYGFEGNGSAVEKRPHHRDCLSASPQAVHRIGTRSLFLVVRRLCRL